jgi:putative hydrolase of the HAD superfamily
MLEDLSKSHDLFLYSCGEESIQIKRVMDVAFDHFFKGVGIPERKTARPLTRFMLANNLSPKSTWVVGNSRKSDIEPALEVGVPASQCILIASYSWSADDANITEPIHVVHELSEVAPIIQKTAVLV